MALVLQPKFSDLSRQEIEDHLEQVRARRMAAVVQYHAEVNVKMINKTAIVQQKLAREYYLLGKDLEKMDKLDAKIAERLETLTGYTGAIEGFQSQMTTIGADDGLHASDED